MLADEARRPAGLRAGFSLIEMVGALMLSSLLGSLAVGACVAQLRLARTVADRVAAADAERTAAFVLGEESRRMIRSDVIAASSDSIAIRAFRGAGIACGRTPDGILVRYTGDRLPAPVKDSVLVVRADRDSAIAITDSRSVPGACPSRDGELVLEWRLAPAAAATDSTVLLVFEVGSYHLAAGALRYRAGAAGRQPLTPELFVHPHTKFVGVTDRAIRFEIRTGSTTTEYAAAFAPKGGSP